MIMKGGTLEKSGVVSSYGSEKKVEGCFARQIPKGWYLVEGQYYLWVPDCLTPSFPSPRARTGVVVAFSIALGMVCRQPKEKHQATLLLDSPA